MIGEVKSVVALKRCTVSSSVSGVCFSTSTLDAPKRIGKQSMPPSPKVNAIGGVPQTTSSLCIFMIERGKQSVCAITSRWKCIVPFGPPVVPEVKEISATSSAAVGTLPKVSGCRIDRLSSESGASSYQYFTSLREGQLGNAAARSAASLLSHNACVTSAFLMISVSSF